MQWLHNINLGARDAHIIGQEECLSPGAVAGECESNLRKALKSQENTLGVTYDNKSLVPSAALTLWNFTCKRQSSVAKLRTTH